MSALLEVGLAIGQVALGAGLASGGRWVRNQVRTRRPASKIWNLNRSKPVHIITASERALDDDEFTARVYPAEYLAAVETRAMVCEVLGHRDVTFWTSESFPTARYMAQNIVSIGGPVHNEVTAHFLRRLSLPIGFDQHEVVSDVTKMRYEAIIEKGRIVRDVGVVVACDNPLGDEDCLVVLLMGSRTFGCPAASQFLTSGDLRTASRRLGTSSPRWAILDADVIDDHVARVKVVESSVSDEM